jgi:hypothetical protein
MKLIKNFLFNKKSKSLISIVFIFLLLTILLPVVNSNTIVKNNIEESFKINVLEKNLAGPDIETEGNLRWTRVRPNSTVTGSFIVKNVGDPGSDLDWRITEYPRWGEWTFTPKSGVDLKPEDGDLTIQVSVVAPAEEANFTGRIKVIETNGDDYNFVLVSLSTPKLKSKDISEKLFFNNYLFFQNFKFLSYILY